MPREVPSRGGFPSGTQQFRPGGARSACPALGSSPPVTGPQLQAHPVTPELEQKESTLALLNSSLRLGKGPLSQKPLQPPQCFHGPARVTGALPSGHCARESGACDELRRVTVTSGSHGAQSKPWKPQAGPRTRVLAGESGGQLCAGTVSAAVFIGAYGWL